MLPVVNPNVIFRSLPDGAVLFSTKDEVYFGLNPVAARVWELLPQTSGSMDELCATLALEYPEVAADALRRDVEELLRDLAEFGLVRTAGAERDGAAQAQTA
jgi:hypothetical protein